MLRQRLVSRATHPELARRDRELGQMNPSKIQVNCPPDYKRQARPMGFSLLEVIIATAALAGSAMVLVSLLGLGTQFGSKAELRTIAISNAQSVMDEFLATRGQEGRDAQEEVTGSLEGRWPMSYRITLSQYALNRQDNSAASAPELLQVSVEIFESETQLQQEAVPPLCRISRLVRPALALGPELSEGEDDSQSGIQNNSNLFSPAMESLPSVPGMLTPSSL